MAEGSLSGLLSIGALILVNALFTVAYAALTNVRTGPLREAAEDGNRRAERVLGLVASPNLTITYQTINTLLHFITAAVALVNVVDNISTGMDITIARVVVLALVALASVVLGDIVPEAIGSGYANNLAMLVLGPMLLTTALMRPVLFVLITLSKLLTSPFKSSGLVNTITEEEIMTLVDAGHTGGTIEDEEKEMIYSVLQLDQTHVSEVMVPRIDIIALDIQHSLDEAGSVFVNSGFSRVPVYEDNIDNIKGLLYAKDLLAHWNRDDIDKTIRDLMRPAYFVPETKRVDELLKELQTQKVHLAIVVDEYGGTAGLVTIENIIEEIIGDIQDEYDLNEEADYEQTGPYEYTVDASIDLDDLNDLLDVDLPTDDSDTLGGYIYTHFGRVPVVGEIIDTEDLTMNVLSVDGRRIRKVHIIRKRTEEEQAEEDDDSASNTEEEITRAS
ncbi:MAG: hemolysin family protein [Anaerolineae bacterium]